MGNRNDGHLSVQFLQRFLHDLLGGAVDAGSGFVEKQDPRPTRQGARNGNELLLSCRQAGAPFVEQRVVTQFQGLDEVVCMG